MTTNKKIIGLIVAGVIVASMAAGVAVLTRDTTASNPRIISSPVDTTRGNIAAGRYSTSICVQGDSIDSWPLQESMNEWNRNGKNILTFSTLECDADIIIQEAIVNQEAWASTTFFDSGVISVTLSPLVPTEHRKHVVCHEFAHVFGIPHTQAQSCSNIDLTIPTPSGEELKWVGSGLWNWRVARSNALHGGR